MHVVFGAGQIGAMLVAELRAAGLPVRVARRSARPIPGAEVVSGDARDPAFVAQVTADATVIYHCMNPSAYTSAAWEAEFLPQSASLLAAARRTGARLVCLDNLYMYGPSDAPLTEDTPRLATGRKGRVRVAWDAQVRAALADGVPVVVGRAGDFFGPGTAQSVVSDEVVRGLGAGQRPWLLGDPSLPHALSYAPDVARALRRLGDPDVPPGIYHLPVIEVAPAELIRRISAGLGREVAPRVAGWWTLRLLSPFVPVFGELLETLYQWDRPFRSDDRRFRALGGRWTDLDAAVAGTVAAVSAAAPPLAAPPAQTA